MTKTILIVDDDAAQRRLLQASIERKGFATRIAENGEQAIAQALDPAIDIVLLDLVMPDASGIDVLAHIHSKRADLPVIAITSSGGIDTVVKAMQAGANDFFVKPVSSDKIMAAIIKALKTERKIDKASYNSKSLNNIGFADIIAVSPAMLKIINLGKRAARTNIPVLLLGESGVGKEVIAKSIHGESKRAAKPIISVNCGAIPANLVESILFGHEKGSFTGANERHKGKFQEADGGTLFLDEVGELPLDIQVKLLRALQEGEVDPIGSKRPVKVDVRIIAATNKDLGHLVKQGLFRQDLYYRLNVFPLEIPSLRNRKEDIRALSKHFIAKFNGKVGANIQGITPAGLMLLENYEWAGNVRQLENTIYRAMVLCDSEYLTVSDFPQLANESDIDENGFANMEYTEIANSEGNDNILLPKISEEEVGQFIPLLDNGGHLRTLEEIERELIQHAIEIYAGHMSEIARRLGIGRSTLYRKLKEYDIDESTIKSSNK